MTARLVGAGIGVAALLVGVTPARAQTTPEIEHAGLNCVVAGQHVVLQVAVTPLEGIISLKAYFRGAPYPLFYFVEMTSAGPGLYQAVLPKPTSELDGMVYYIEAMDSSYAASRTLEYTPQVVDGESECRDRNPVAAVYLDGPAAITVGATGAGTAYPPGFLADGIIGTIASTGRIASGGSTTLLAVAGAGAAAAGVGVLVAGNGDEESSPDEPGPPVAGPPPDLPEMPAPPMAPAPPPSTGTPPRACFETSPMPALIAVGDAVRFDASCSEPSRDQVSSYEWSFGDGRPGREGRVVSRQYMSPGTFAVELTLTDAQGGQDRTSRDVVVEELAPTPAPGGGGGGGSPGPGPANTVTISKSGPSGIDAGVQFPYRVSVTNTGSGTASGITVTDAIPSGLSLVDVTFTAGADACGQSGSTVTCTAASLAPGAGFTVTIEVISTGPGPVTNVASLTVASPSESASASASTVILSKAPTDDARRRRPTTFVTTVELHPPSPSAEAVVRFEGGESSSAGTNAPRTVTLHATAGGDVVRGELLGPIPGSGTWHFDFRGTTSFEPGSIEVEGGQVVAVQARQVRFRVTEGARTIRFRFRLRP